MEKTKSLFFWSEKSRRCHLWPRNHLVLACPWPLLRPAACSWLLLRGRPVQPSRVSLDSDLPASTHLFLTNGLMGKDGLSQQILFLRLTPEARNAPPRSKKPKFADCPRGKSQVKTYCLWPPVQNFQGISSTVQTMLVWHLFLISMPALSLGIYPIP